MHTYVTSVLDALDNTDALHGCVTPGRGVAATHVVWKLDNSNVWEWVSDWYYRTYYRFGKKKNPKGPLDGEFKVVRGGSWVNFPDTLRSSLRRWSRPDVLFNDTGFRCAKDAVDETDATENN